MFDRDFPIFDYMINLFGCCGFVFWYPEEVSTKDED